MALHDLAHPGRIRRRRAAGGYGHFPEEFRPENAWRENAKHFRNRLRLVDEPVDNTARDEEIISRLDLDALAGDRPSDDALKTVDRFFPVAVMVRDRHTGVWRIATSNMSSAPLVSYLVRKNRNCIAPTLMSPGIVVVFRYAIEKIAGRVSSSAPN